MGDIRHFAQVFSFLLTISLLVLMGHVPTVRSDDDPVSDLIVFRTFEWGYESVTVVTGEPVDMHCKIQYKNEEVTYENLMLENVTMTFFKDDVQLPDFWTANETILEEHNVKPLSPYSFEYNEGNSSHRGYYWCVTEYRNLTGSKRFFVRIRDDPSPLWPGVAFGGEVLLFAFILGVYELTRNKDVLEQEESDNED